MSEIKDKSAGVLPWATESLGSVPPTKGIYVLRNLPTINGIIYISFADNLKKDLSEQLLSESIPDAAWFDWYTTENKDEAEKIAKSWISKYLPKYNRE